MHTAPAASSTPDYSMLVRQIASILEGETSLIANAAQFSAFVYDTVAQLNWAGFYLARPIQQRQHQQQQQAGGATQELLVGPFQGKVACALIPFGRGVCGAAALERRTIVVPDVHAFPGHIACDCASKAEIVIPVIKNGVLYGVFDIDSPVLDRFSQEDQLGLEALVAAFVAATEFT